MGVRDVQVWLVPVTVRMGVRDVQVWLVPVTVRMGVRDVQVWLVPVTVPVMREEREIIPMYLPTYLYKPLYLTFQT
jgi:hypothetical protein